MSDDISNQETPREPTTRRRIPLWLLIENIERVKAKIKEMDEFEYEYLPKKLIAPFSEYPRVEYTHKFDSLDLHKLTADLWKEGIHIFCLDNGHGDWIKDS